ncbi:RagB/SusD family nutrient uptake outer membrane protein [Halosquirtibacter laminarini]|uniref:RagB/SusD family nutrient uptake outer membrane protein n=1 Tax=Halosquirtibacter laminarini TaxID=3374600 RepID=A0AC61NKG7_9BACT|nr:RagB/SusD family nutrient uptake outer membrane protein [Prolixibacteraceae bacterium]
MKFRYTILIAALIFSLVGCNDFLDTDNLYQKSLDNFYQTPTDIEEAMGGVYNALYVGGISSNEHVTANLLSDLMFSGGGPDDKLAKNIDGFNDPDEDTYKDLWVETYNGIYRCNAIIEKASTTDFTSFFKTEQASTDFKNQSVGEAYFMRGFLLFRAAKFFGGMPLILSTDAPRNVDRATFTETFSQIASDFKTASDMLPRDNALDISIDRYGHANVWVAKAYLARVYMFYTGYMTNIEKSATDVLPLVSEGELTKQMTVDALDDIIANSGYELASDFRNLWPYSYVNEAAGKDVLPWAANAGLSWVGQDGPHSSIGTGNKEVMFAQRFAFGNWDWDKGQSYNNRVCLYFGVRENSMVPFGQGWGWGTVNPMLYDQWDDSDTRKKGSILELGDADQGTDSYKGDVGDQETGYFNKKYTTLQHDGEDGVKGLFYYLYDMDNGDPLQLWAAQDFYYLRFADILLMQSELTETNVGLNRVRERAGLDAIAYSLDVLKEERMHEFAFEGIRWFDLVRWGDVEKAGANYFQRNIPISNMGVESVYNVTYRPETKGLLPIPESEIRLSNGVYKQNPGW